MVARVPRLDAMIRLVSVRRVFGAGETGVVALEGIDLEVGPGEFVAVAGPSGSGKTSLLNLIGALDEPSGGRVEFDSIDVGRLDDAARAELRLRRMGFVFQDHNLVPVLTAAENVELPLLFRGGLSPAERRSAVDRALERVGLADKRGRRPAELSGGERQRAAVARAVAGRPAVLLADEPTAHLDHEAGARVIGLMREINVELRATVLYATHDPELIALAQRVIRLRDGRLVDCA
jgi:putative ABC transport system ATP-binding protein